MSVDINNLNLNEETVSVDYSNVDSFFSPALPDDGRHPAILKLGDRGVSGPSLGDKAPRVKKGASAGSAYVGVHVMLEVLDDSGNKIGTCFDQVTSIPMNGMSRLHAMLFMAGFPPPANCSLVDLEEFTKSSLAQAPRVGIETQWQAQWEDPKKAKGDPDKYSTFLKGQKKFPMVLDESGEPTGRHLTEAIHPPSGDICKAQVKVVKYFKL